MLNVLRILSWFVVVFAVLTVIVLFGMWQTGEKEIVGFLKQQSAIDQMRLQNSDEDEQQGDCRLVLASIAFARRLNPPVVRDEAAVKDPQDGQEEVTDSIIRKPPDTDIKTPPLATPKFELIGTFAHSFVKTGKRPNSLFRKNHEVNSLSEGTVFKTLSVYLLRDLGGGFDS